MTQKERSDKSCIIFSSWFQTDNGVKSITTSKICKDELNNQPNSGKNQRANQVGGYSKYNLFVLEERMSNFTSSNASFEQVAARANVSLGQAANNYTPYLTTLYISALLFTLLSPITVTSNGLLLVAIYRDPFKCFRTPVTFFIISLAIVDLLTGLIVEPLFAVYYFACYSKQTVSPGKYFEYLLYIGGFFSLFLISSSFLLVLALTTTQYIAITFPHKYRIFFTKKRVLMSVVGSFVYFIIFSSLQFTKIPKDLFLKVNLHLHPTVVGFLLTVAHIFLFKSFCKFVKQSNALRRPRMAHQSTNPYHPAGNGSKSEARQQKHLTVVALFLSALLLLCSIPHIVSFYIFLYTEDKSFTFLVKVGIALRVSDIVLFIKVALDAYIYAWRHPKYRNALKGTMFCYMKHLTNGDAEQELVATALTRASTKI